MDDMIVESISITQQEDYTILMSIPGIGPTLAAQLLSEIGPVSDFAEPAKLVSFAGLNPSVAQSAGVLRTGHITKKWQLKQHNVVSKRRGQHFMNFMHD